MRGPPGGVAGVARRRAVARAEYAGRGGPRRGTLPVEEREREGERGEGRGEEEEEEEEEEG